VEVWALLVKREMEVSGKLEGQLKVEQELVPRKFLEWRPRSKGDLQAAGMGTAGRRWKSSVASFSSG
jgi:hypothetical protein